jgi:hypothetical protein
MTRDEIQAVREEAVFRFLDENYGSTLISEKFNSAIIRTGGFSEDQRRLHRRMMFFTLGLWTPVFVTVALLRRPREVLIHVFDNGFIERLEL